jgi:hypothetical protein
MAHFRSDSVPSIAEKGCPPAAVVEIELWEAFLVNHSCVFGRHLVRHSIDKSPFVKANLAHGRICYRFTGHTWNRSVRVLLNENRVPVLVREVSAV